MQTQSTPQMNEDPIHKAETEAAFCALSILTAFGDEELAEFLDDHQLAEWIACLDAIDDARADARHKEP